MKHLTYLTVLLLVIATLLPGCCHTTSNVPPGQTAEDGKNVAPAVGNPGPRY